MGEVTLTTGLTSPQYYGALTSWHDDVIMTSCAINKLTIRGLRMASWS